MDRSSMYVDDFVIVVAFEVRRIVGRAVVVVMLTRPEHALVTEDGR